MMHENRNTSEEHWHSHKQSEICCGQQEFYKMMRQIDEKMYYLESLENAHELYNINPYNVKSLTPNTIIQFYQSVCKRVYLNETVNHQQNWFSHELKIFIWLIICNLREAISEPEKISIQTWEKYSKIFHGKNIELMQFQAKVLVSSGPQLRKWQKQEENLLLSIMTRTQSESRWNENAKMMYFMSGKVFFRSPKQIREKWFNHLNPQIIKDRWSQQEDQFIIETVAKIGKKWSQVAKLSGNTRTEHMIKNRYYLLNRNIIQNDQQQSKKVKKEAQKQRMDASKNSKNTERSPHLPKNVSPAQRKTIAFFDENCPLQKLLQDFEDSKCSQRTQFESKDIEMKMFDIQGISYKMDIFEQLANSSQEFTLHQ